LPSLALEKKQQTETTNLYELQDLLPHDVTGTHAQTLVYVPDWAFKPDHWTTTFLRGLIKARHALASACLWEVGVGTGINLIALSTAITDATWYFSDYNPDCVELASQNLKAAGIASRYNPLPGKRNLVQGEVGQEVPMVDVVFGCLPQVPTTHSLDQGDRIAHYYDPSLFPRSRRHACGLGLNEALLMGAKKVLHPKGKVILNLSGRSGKERLEGMFNECGYSSRILHEAIVPQHATTSLKSLATIESEDRTGPEFEFFADPEARMPLCASHAEARRCKGDPVYHKIFVFEATQE